MTTKRIVSGLFVSSLIAACSAAGDPPSDPAFDDGAKYAYESTGPLSFVGEVVSASLASSKEGTQTLRLEGAGSLRLHFNRLELAPGAKLVIEGSKGGKAKLTAADNGVDVWAPTLDGEATTVRLAYDGGGAPGSYAVDKVTRGFPEADGSRSGPGALDAVSAVCGADTRKRAACYADALRFPGVFNAARAVGRMAIVRADKSVACTGFLVSADNLFLTNHHCLNAADNLNSFEVLFNYQYTQCTSTAEETRVDFKASGQIVASSAALDYTLVRLAPNPLKGNAAALFGFIELDPQTPPVANATEIYIPQQPLGRHKTVAYFDVDADADDGGDPDDVRCKIKATNLNVSGNTPGANVGYLCDTDGGSSGSPVLLHGTNKAIALHHAGGCTTGGVYNVGINIGNIYREIEPHLGGTGSGGSGGSGGTTGSCRSWCGGQSLDGCWCDNECDANGDCCPDKATSCGPSTIAPDSCQGRCGTKAPAGCLCGGGCESVGDCCPDKVQFCN